MNLNQLYFIEYNSALEILQNGVCGVCVCVCVCVCVYVCARARVYPISDTFKVGSN